MFEEFIPHCIKQYLSVNKAPAVFSFIDEVFCGYPNKKDYWSLSKFAKWVESLQGIYRPYAATSQGWREFEEEHRHKVAYKFTEFLGKLQDKVCYPIYCVNRFKWAFRNWFIDETTKLKATSLNSWEYRDLDTVLLHAVFDEFIAYIDRRYGKHPIVEFNRLIELYNEEYKQYTGCEGSTFYDHRKHIQISKDLYIWWKYQYITDRRLSNESYYELENAKLNQLISIRCSLW